MAQTTLLSATITTALTASITAPALVNLDNYGAVALHCNFTYGSSGTNAKFWVQSSLDGGSTWYDVACFAATTASKIRIYNLSNRTAVSSIATPTDGTLADDTSVDGILGDRLRVKTTTTGTYAGSTTVVISAVPH